MRVLVNSCIRELDKIGVRGRGKLCVVRFQEEGRHAVSKIYRAVIIKIMKEDRKKCNIMTVRKKDEDSQRRGVEETKSF